MRIIDTRTYTCKRCGKTVTLVVFEGCFTSPPDPDDYVCTECARKEIERLLKKIQESEETDKQSLKKLEDGG